MSGPAPTAKSATGSVTREARLRVPASYIRNAGTGSVIAERKVLTQEDLILEFMLNAVCV